VDARLESLLAQIDKQALAARREMLLTQLTPQAIALNCLTDLLENKVALRAMACGVSCVN
jgi:hypothetical protein